MKVTDVMIGLIVVQFVALCVILMVGVYYLTDIGGLGVAVVITTAFIVMTMGTLLSPKTGGI